MEVSLYTFFQKNILSFFPFTVNIYFKKEAIHNFVEIYNHFRYTFVGIINYISSFLAILYK